MRSALPSAPLATSSSTALQYGCNALIYSCIMYCRVEHDCTAVQLYSCYYACSYKCTYYSSVILNLVSTAAVLLLWYSCMIPPPRASIRILKSDKREAARAPAAWMSYSITVYFYSKTGIYTGTHVLVLSVPILLYMFLHTHLRFQ